MATEYRKSIENRVEGKKDKKFYVGHSHVAQAMRIFANTESECMSFLNLTPFRFHMITLILLTSSSIVQMRMKPHNGGLTYHSPHHHCRFFHPYAVKISRSGSLIIAAVRSGDSIGTCPASTSLLIQSMFRIAHLPSLQVEGTIFVHLFAQSSC
ncbi:hypothetical protein BDV33DRAFT_60580 [Aspergillus novoparasiticus]|uniref:Uncharacterized protein n=1 Tax=Aspergillus novoparasiticus TaxID=986946 RepID=A0A5N6E7C2_9EURO|nr:hypothetical protein BDV33DRAFT_60580 [Aspergillus novoparasiticus]